MAPVWAREESPTALLVVPEPVAVACEPVLWAPVLELPAPWEPVTVSVVQPAAGTVRLAVVPVVLPEPVVSVDEVVAAVVQSWPSSVEVAGAVDSEPAGVVGRSAAGLAGADGLADSEGWSAGVVAQSVAPAVGTMTVVPCRCVVGVGTVEQSLVGSVVAGVEGSVLGSVVAGVEGSVDGSVDGSVEGWSSGMTEPLPGVAGVVVGVLGSVEGSVVAGVLGCVVAGVSNEYDIGIAPLNGIVVALALCGGLIGFAPFNKPVARIFLGDVGSLPIGLLFAWLLLLVAGHGHLVAALVLPLYYLADATLTLGRRAVRGEKVWQAHRTHFYQRATDRGWKVPNIVAHVFGVNAVLVVLAAVSVLWPSPLGAAIALFDGAAVVAWLLYRFSTPRRTSQP